MGIDASIYSQYLKPPKSVQEFDAEYAQGEANKLNALIGRQTLGLNNLKMDEYKRGVERSNALRDVTGRSATLAPDQRINALRVGGFGAEADAAEKSWLERQKAEAEIQSKKIDDAKKRIGMMASSSKFVVDNPSYDSLVAQSKFLVEAGLLKPEQAEASLASAKDMTPEQIKAKAMLGFQSAIDADKQLPKTDSANLGGSMSFGATSPITGIRTETGSAPITESANNIANNLRMGEQGKLNRDVQWAQLAETKAQHKAANQRADARLEFDKTKPQGAKGPMSVTLQKELIESDDSVQAAGNVVKALETAKTQNAKAYSGYFAKARAQLASNVIPGSTESADASIDIDNLMTGGALEQLKTVFGAMPTEGERKVLMEMQASLDKTPKQREAIMDRAIALAKKRASYASAKAKSIRDGSYLTDGAALPGTEPAKPAAKTVVRTGTQNGRKVIQYSDGSIEYGD